MGVLQTLARLVGEQAGDPHTALQEAYVGLMVRAHLLGVYAERAPQAHSRDALRQLAEAETAQAERLAAVLRGAGRIVSAPTDVPQPLGAMNHWGRLVQVLEAHRAAAQVARELAVRYADTHPSIAAVFDELRRTEQAHGQALRALIARADPQALD